MLCNNKKMDQINKVKRQNKKKMKHYFLFIILYLAIVAGIYMYMYESDIVFEGIQRPLEDICTLTESIYIPKGVNTPALDRSKKWEFEPFGRIRVR